MQRWLIAGLSTLLVIGVPLVVREVPASRSSLTAEALLQRATSADESYSGYVEALGTLQLPVASGLSELGPLFGERTRLRSWWVSDDRWRVDQIFPTGEKGFYHSNTTTTIWAYEDFAVKVLRDSGARLPRAPDLLPPLLTRYLLGDSTGEAATRIGEERIAGKDTAGVRVTASDPRSSIDHVDVWIEPTSGLPLRIKVYDKTSDRVALTSTFLDFSLAVPSESDVEFVPPDWADREFPRTVDIADAANRFAPVRVPRSVAGYDHTGGLRLKSVGSYGTGLTRFVVIPLPADAASGLREQLSRSPIRERTSEGPVVSVGPVSLLATRWTDSPLDGGWLIAGSLTPDALVEVADELGEPETIPRSIE